MCQLLIFGQKRDCSQPTGHRLRASSLSFAQKFVGKNGRKNVKQHEHVSVICEAASRKYLTPEYHIQNWA